MTKKEFLVLLEKYGKGKFKIDGWGLIRTFETIGRGCRLCPLEYVYAREKHMAGYEVKGLANFAGRSLGLAKRDIRAIVFAADKRSSKYRAELKKSLHLD